MGWGEFEAGIRIFFKDPDEKVSPPLHQELIPFHLLFISIYPVCRHPPSNQTLSWRRTAADSQEGLPRPLPFLTSSCALSPSPPQPVMHEFYDEIVFTNPHPDFFANLMLYTPPPPDTRPLTHLTVLPPCPCLLSVLLPFTHPLPCFLSP
jgi:hypothetical protein